MRARSCFKEAADASEAGRAALSLLERSVAPKLQSAFLAVWWRWQRGCTGGRASRPPRGSRKKWGLKLA